MYRPLDQFALTHEQVVCIRYIASDAEELHQIMELAMYVAAYLQRTSISMMPSLQAHTSYRHRRIDAHHVALLNE